MGESSDLRCPTQFGPFQFEMAVEVADDDTKLTSCSSLLSGPIVVTEKLDGNVRVIAVDLLPMDALPSVEFIQGDFTSDEVLGELREAVGDARADLVISDMAPNISGQRAVDQPRSMYLVELALDFCRECLAPGGDFVCKVFQGEGTDEFIAEAKRAFERVKVLKPKASRTGSREVYLVARNYRL